MKNKTAKSHLRHPPFSRHSLFRHSFVQMGLILVIGLGLYLRILNAPFIFDDFLCIVENPAISNFSYFGDFSKVTELKIDADVKNNFALRPVAYFTFALNYRFWQFNVASYHLVNILVHLTNALLVYLLAKVTLDSRAAGSPDSGLHGLLPLTAALFFTVHPIQTQAVTYIVQRFTSLATLFYLSALLLYIKARTASRPAARWSCYGLALAVTVVAMKTKEIAFTLPLIMLLYDFFFLSGRLKERLIGLIPFFLTMAIIPATLIWLMDQSGPAGGNVIDQSINLVNFAKVSRWDYLETQFGVIVAYLRLLVLPYGQNLDHDYRLAQSFFEPKVATSFLLLLTLLSVAVRLYLRSLQRVTPTSFRMRLVSFGILWFFLTISVESSIIPIDDLLVEHRIYLPSVGFFLSVLALADWFAVNHALRGRIMLVGWLVAVAVFSATNLARNELYRDPVRMYQDVVRKSPAKPRAHMCLGLAYLDKQQYDEAISEFELILQHKPDQVEALIQLGNALLGKGLIDSAIHRLQAALQYAPDNHFAHGNLGAAYLKKGWHSGAEKEFKAALGISPHFGFARYSLARLYEGQGRTAEAIQEYRELLRFYPYDEEVADRLRQLTGGLEM